MAEHLGLIDESTTNPCCSAWKDRCLKLQIKIKKAEDGRAALKRAVEIYRQQFDKAQDESLTLKKAYEEEKLQTDHERKDKEKELAARVSLEKEISALKSEILSLRQKGGLIPAHVNEELILLRGRVFDNEKEINSLREEKKKADEVYETSKTEKNRVDQELSNLKAQLHNVEKEKKQLKKDLQKEKARSHSEKKRADEVLKTTKTEQAEVETLKAEKKNTCDVSSLRFEDQNLVVITSLKGHVSEMETEIHRLKELLDKERRLMDNERKKAETEKNKANKMQEMFEREESTAAEQRRLVDVERKKAKEFAHQLQRLKCEADEARSKLILEDSKLKEANKKLDAERKKAIKEKKKALKQQKIAEMSTKHALEKEHHADSLQQKLEENQKMYEKLKKDMEELELRIQEEKQKTNNGADLAMENETEQKRAADMYKLEAMKEKSRADKLALQLEDIKKRTKSASKEIQDLVSFRNITDLMKIRSAEMEILKKRLKLEKARVKHANEVAELEKKCKEAVEEELRQLKLEFARLCSCFSICNVGTSCLEKNGNGNSKRKITHSESGKELVKPTYAATKSCQFFKPSLNSPSPSLPISGACTVSTSGTASIIEPLLGGSNRKNLDNYALPSSMASFSDRQLVGSQGNCRFSNIEKNSDLQLHTSRLSSKADDTVKSNKDVNTKKRKRHLNEIESIVPLSTEGHAKVAMKVSSPHSIFYHMDKQLKEVHMQRSCMSIEHNGDFKIIKRMLDGDCMKLLNLDSEVEEERYLVAVERPLSPTLPIINFESNQSDDCRPIEVNCSYGGLPNQYDDSSQFIVVFPEIRDDSSRLSKIVQMTRTCCADSQSDYVVKNVVSALSTDEILSPKEKVCVFFSCFLKRFSSIAMTDFNHVFDGIFWNNIDTFSEEIRKVMSDVETKTMFTEIWNLDDLITLIQNFIIDGRLLVCTDVNSETGKAALHQFVIGAVLLASVCAAFDLIDSICEVLYISSRLTTSSTLTFLHVFAYVCGEKLLSHGDDSLILTVIESLVTYYERENLLSGFPPCTNCPFSDNAVSLEEIASLLLKKLSDCCMQKFGMTTYKSVIVPDDSLSNLGDVLSLLELLASKMSWGWVCKNIISPLLKLLEVCVAETPLTAIFVLLGQMARFGIDANRFHDAEVENIRVKLSSFISQSTSSKMSLAVQFAAVNA